VLSFRADKVSSLRVSFAALLPSLLLVLCFIVFSTQSAFAFGGCEAAIGSTSQGCVRISVEIPPHVTGLKLETPYTDGGTSSVAFDSNFYGFVQLISKSDIIKSQRAASNTSLAAISQVRAAKFKSNKRVLVLVPSTQIAMIIPE